VVYWIALSPRVRHHGVNQENGSHAMRADLREQLELVRNELELVNKLLLEESLMGFPDGDRRTKLNQQREELKMVERELLERLAQQ